MILTRTFRESTIDRENPRAQSEPRETGLYGRVKRRLTQLGISQSEMFRRAGMPVHGTFWKITDPERRTIGTLRRLARGLGWSLPEVLGHYPGPIDAELLRAAEKTAEQILLTLETGPERRLQLVVQVYNSLAEMTREGWDTHTFDPARGAASYLDPGAPPPPALSPRPPANPRRCPTAPAEDRAPASHKHSR